MDKKQTILVAGAGNIGTIIAQLLSKIGDWQILLVDQSISHLNLPSKILVKQADIAQAHALFELICKHKVKAIVSCLPYFCNLTVAEVAKANQCHYFDLTEDVSTTVDIFELSKKARTAFVPQCGVAPGFINTLANDLIKQCDKVEEGALFCGALPQKPEPPLDYALTWSTEGLMNEYGNDCRILENSAIKYVPGLSDLQNLILENEAFEVFHTSGGIGTLVDSYQNKISTLSYKTIRFPGHCKKMLFLMRDLKLNDDRNTLKKILETAVPKTKMDFVILHIKVIGQKQGSPVTLETTKRFYPSKLDNHEITAIQMVTSSAAAAVIYTVLTQPHQFKGPIKQENFNLDMILQSPFGAYLKGQ